MVPATPRSPECEINQKYIAMLAHLIMEQNRQLLKIIAEDHNLNFKTLADKLLTTRTKFNDELKKLAMKQVQE